MARPPLAIGSHGNITTKQFGDQWRASARFRDADGCTRKVERWGSGSTDEKAKRNLRAALRDRMGKSGSRLAQSSKVGDVARVWIDQIEQKRAGTTFDTYSVYLHNVVLPELGNLRLSECTVGRLEYLMDQLASDDYSAEARRSVRTVLSGIFGLAVRRDLLGTNPVKQMAPIEGGPRRKARVMTTAELSDFLIKLDADSVARRYDLPDLVRFMLGTGVRLGEALAVRWCDLDLGNREININGNIVAVKSQGLIRHDGKTFTAQRLIAMPEYLHTLLTVRRRARAYPDEPVFPAGTLTSGGQLTWKWPANTAKSIRRLRARIGYEWVTSHVFRKTVATLLDTAGQTPREVADLLGHAKVSMTQDVYMGRGIANPGAAAALDAAYAK